MLMHYVFILDSVFKSVPRKTQNQLDTQYVLLMQMFS